MKRDGEFIVTGKLVRSYTVVLARLDGVQAHEAEDGQRPTGGREDAEGIQSADGGRMTVDGGRRDFPVETSSCFRARIIYK